MASPRTARQLQPGAAAGLRGETTPAGIVVQPSGHAPCYRREARWWGRPS
ncbi:hypothetical protein GQ55_6G142600 [Panicum hallii var. hallii]|uniref:Uncharacterized protein n=1 Tax=Panicum hallii var. hallii TaxID=1504633 RepID=A0A2T7D658_9POAL|nr:hypothetical protein GQ55_6G142600 [Panicum hallii var. hallii]